jgi:hypothetical protein
MFTARIKLTGKPISFHAMNSNGNVRKINVDDDTRKKKLDSLLKICKQQKFAIEVSHVFEEGEMVAYVRSAV